MQTAFCLQKAVTGRKPCTEPSNGERGKTMAELSPMMQQYLEIKKQHKDEILFYRIGDFYEMFFEDALTASKELDLTLTGKQCGLEERAPMCGVPFHSYEGYVARLIAKGYKVAICEQVEDPAKAKGLVKRDIIRVVTPGTVIESSMLQDDRNNYIASIYLKGKKAGLCFADVSTGTAHITELAADKIAPAVITELCRFHPSEVLMNPGLLDCREVTAYIKKNMTCSVELVEDERYAPGLVAASLESQFGRDWPQTTGMAENGLVRFAMAALLEYLHDTQIKGVERLKTVVTYNEAQFMRLSPVTRANLELTETLRGREKRGTLLWVLDKTSTAMGKRMLRSWIEQPLLSSKLINQRLNAVESLVRQTVVRGDLTDELHYIADMERLMTRTVYGSATPKEIYTLAQTCEHLPVLRQQATACGCPELAELAEEIDPLEDIKARIYAAVDPDAPSTLKDGGVIAKGYHTEVDELRSIRDNTKGVLAQLEARLRQETGIPKLKIGYNHVFGYYIEQLLQKPCAGDLHPQADPDQRRALHYAGAQGAGKQDPGRTRAADHAGAPPVRRAAGEHQRPAGPHPAHSQRRGKAGCADRPGAGGGGEQLLPPRGG